MIDGVENLDVLESYCLVGYCLLIGVAPEKMKSTVEIERKSLSLMELFDIAGGCSLSWVEGTGRGRNHLLPCCFTLGVLYGDVIRAGLLSKSDSACARLDLRRYKWALLLVALFGIET